MTRPTPDSLNIRNLKIKYDNKTVINIPALTIKTGTYTLITGPTGCGKTSLALTLAGVLKEMTDAQKTGEITLAGTLIPESNTSTANHPVAAVWQNPHAQLFRNTILDEVRAGLDFKQTPAAAGDTLARHALQLVGLNHLHETRDPLTLSGGEQQRLALAAALALETPILVLDEVTSQLDNAANKQLAAIIAAAQKQFNKIVIAFDHRPDPHLKQATRVIVLDSTGQIALDGTPHETYARHAAECRKIGIRTPHSSIEANHAEHASLKRAVIKDAQTLATCQPCTKNRSAQNTVDEYAVDDNAGSKDTAPNTTRLEPVAPHPATIHPAAPAPATSVHAASTPKAPDPATPAPAAFAPAAFEQERHALPAHASPAHTLSAQTRPTQARPVQAFAAHALSVHAFSGSALRRKRCKTLLLRDVFFTLPPGATALLLGANGSGKTTLLNCVAGMQQRMTGSISPGRRERRRLGVGFAPQRGGELFFAGTLRAELATVIVAAGVAEAVSVRRRVDALLVLAGLFAQADVHPQRLSGGQRQRFCTLLAVAASPGFVLLDEPTNNQDAFGVAQTLRLIRHDVGGRVMFIVTHEPHFFADVATHRITLNAGVVTGVCAL